MVRFTDLTPPAIIILSYTRNTLAAQLMTETMSVQFKA